LAAGFTAGAEISGYISGDTDIPHTGSLTLTVARHIGSANSLTGYAFIRPNGVGLGSSAASGFCFAGLCSYSSPNWIFPNTLAMSLNPQNQTGSIFFEGHFIEAGAPVSQEYYLTHYFQPWQATITKVAVNVPEPATLWLLTIGGLTVITRRLHLKAVRLRQFSKSSLVLSLTARVVGGMR
jgi:hypothetical protein